MNRSLFVPSSDLRESIAILERRDLLERKMARPNLGPELTDRNLLRIRKLAGFWRSGDDRDSHSLDSVIEDLVAGFYGQGQALIYVILGAGNEIRILWGLPGVERENGEFLAKILTGALPHACIENVEPSSLFQEINALPYCARVSGIPSRRGEGISDSIERLIRALARERFAYVVLAKPVGPSAINATFETIAEEAKEIKNSYLRAHTGEADNNPLAQYYLDLLNAGLEKFRIGKIQGSWEVETYLFSQSLLTLERGETILTSIFSGKESVPAPIRIHRCHGSEEREAASPPGVLNTLDLSLMVAMPREEFPGYGITPYVRFAVALSRPETARRVAIGRVFDGGVPTGGWFEVAVDDLTKHVFVGGVTGSGKTNTCMFVLDQLWRENRVPFLVIEPSMKAEYRDLRAADWGRDLRIFTLGKETEAPFRLNPFEVQEGTLVQTHIDHLRSLFTASFAGLYAPMPYILEEAIQQVYFDRGWDLATGENPRGRGPRSFPTLTDLMAKVEEVVDKAAYDRETTQNIRSALGVRLRSLRTGAKGLMLDTRASVTFAELLEKPAVLELSAIGDDEEKAFLIGLLLIRLCEYRASQMAGGVSQGLRHLTVIEEAHRLLRNVPLDSDNVDASHAKAKAVETFCNLLAEIRGFGEGVVVCEQIPAKLAPDATKNTAVKIFHRTVAEDDRQRIGSSMNMTLDQQRKIASLGPGEGAAYAEGMDGPFLVKVPSFREHGICGVQFEAHDVASHMAHFYTEKSTLPFIACQDCTVQRICNRTRTAVRPVLNKTEFRESFDRFFLSILEGDGITGAHGEVLELFRCGLHLRSETEALPYAYCGILHECERSMDEKGRFYGLSFDEVEALIERFMNVVAALNRSRIGEARIGKDVAPKVSDFRDQYVKLVDGRAGPAMGCKLCKVPCRYHHEVNQLLGDGVLIDEFDAAISNAPVEQLWPELARVGLSAAQRLSDTRKPDVRQNLALCFAVQMADRRGYRRREQERLARNVAAVLEVAAGTERGVRDEG